MNTDTREGTLLIFKTLRRAVDVSRSPGLSAIPVEVSTDALESLDQNIFGDIADVLRLLNGKRLRDFDQFFEAILEVKPRVRNLRPYKKIFDTLLARWERFILDDTRRARARLYFELHSVALGGDRLGLDITVRNVGGGEAWGIKVELKELPSGEFVILQRPQIDDFQLEPRDKRTLQFEIESKEKQIWQLEFPYRYSDASGYEQKDTFRTEIGVVGKKSDTFSPIKNPYIVGIPLATEEAFEVFVNREKTIEYLKAHLGGSVLNLYGLRRVGKSSVLRQLPRLLGEERSRYLPVYIDVAEVLLDPIKNEADLLYSIAYATYLTLKEMEIEVPRPDETKIGRLPREFFDNYMGTISDIIGDRELILMLDEYEAIDEAIQRGRIEASLVTYLDPARFQPKVSLLFSGTRSLEELGWTKLAAGVVASTSSRIGLFNEEEVRKLVLEPIRPHEDEPPAIRYDPLTIQAIWEATAGHPAFVQLLCYFLVEWYNERQLAYMTSQDVDLVIESILESPNRAHVEYFLDGFSKEERLALLILTEALHLRKPDRQWLSRLADRHADVDFPVIKLLDGLIEKGVITKDVGRYDFSMDLVRRWIDKYEPREATYE